MIYVDIYEQEVQVITYDTGEVVVTTENLGYATQATQAQVNAGTATGVYVSPKTLEEKVVVVTASGTDTYTATIPGTLTSGRRVYVKFTNANTGAATLNGTAIKKSVNTALSSGDIAAGEVKLLAYDGTNFQVVGGSGSGSATPSINVEGGTERKITDMTALTAANSADADLIPIVDVSDTTDAASGTNKRILVSEIKKIGQPLNRVNYFNPFVISAGNLSTTAPSINRLSSFAFELRSKITVTDVAVEITTGTSGTFRLGIYNSGSDYLPSSLLVDFGEKTVTSPTTYSYTGLSLVINPGVYYFAINQNTANTFRGVAGSEGRSIGPVTFGTNVQSQLYYVALTYGALPDPFPTVGTTWAGGQICPVIALTVS